LIKNHPELVKWIKNIVGGEFQIENNQIFFSYQKGLKIPLHLASAMVASQVEMDFYLKCLAKKGDILLIDEPEQNLHPANQRKMARLFVRLIKAGVKVFVTTHSDYLIKELNNLIVFNNSFCNKDEIMKKYMYTEKDVLDRSLVKAYAAEKNTLVSADIDEMGIEVTSFDKEIDEMNYIYDDMLFAMAA
jgi:predicted ATPase